MIQTLVAAVATLIIISAGIEPAGAQNWQPPSDAERCPSRWGAEDERGAANLMQADVILRAARLIQVGEVIELGFPLHHDMPFYGDRIYNQQIKRTRSGLGANNRSSNEEIITTELGQIGTQIDGFGHQSIGNSLYNCFQLDDVATRTEFTKLGIENAGGMFTRAVLIDVAGLHGTEMLGERYEITAQDLRAALERQDLTLTPGDAVIVNTGYGLLWGVDNERYYRSQPGLGVAAAEWLVTQDPMIVGSDSCCVEVNPNPEPRLSSPVHQILLVTHGIYLIESMKLDELVEREIYEFAFVVQPLKLRGATGSAIAPIAIR
jgi:kynurenine formamidase